MILPFRCHSWSKATYSNGTWFWTKILWQICLFSTFPVTKHSHVTECSQRQQFHSPSKLIGFFWTLLDTGTFSWIQPVRANVSVPVLWVRLDARTVRSQPVNFSHIPGRRPPETGQRCVSQEILPPRRISTWQEIQHDFERRAGQESSREAARSILTLLTSDKCSFSSLIYQRIIFKRENSPGGKSFACPYLILSTGGCNNCSSGSSQWICASRSHTNAHFPTYISICKAQQK